MAHANIPGCDQLVKWEKQCDQLKEWREQLTRFEDKVESEREELAHDLRTRLPKILKEIHGLITEFDQGSEDIIHALDVVLGYVIKLSESIGRLISHRLQTIDKLESYKLKSLKKQLDDINALELKKRIASSRKKHEVTSYEEDDADIAKEVEKDPKEEFEKLREKFRNVYTRDPMKNRNDDTMPHPTSTLREGETVLAVKVKVWNPNQRHEIFETIPLDDKEHIATEFYHIHPRQLSDVSDLAGKVVKELDLTEVDDENEFVLQSQEGQFLLSVPLDVISQYSKYNMRTQKNNGTWETTEGKSMIHKKCIHFLFESLSEADVVVTSATLEQSLCLVPSKDTEYSFVENPKVKLHCPKEAVESPLHIDVSLTSTDETFAQCNLEKCPTTNIVGIASIVHIKHAKPFEKDLSLTFPIMMLTDDDLSSCDIVSFHFVDDVFTMEQVDNDHLYRNDDNTYTLKTSLFTGQTVAAINCVANSAQAPVETAEELGTIHGITEPCNIIIFLGKGANNKDWMMMTEIVPESKIEDRIVKRTADERYVVPVCSRSPSIVIKRNDIIQVSINKRGAMQFGPEVRASNPPVIRYFNALKENYALFPAIVKQGIGNSTRGIVEFYKGKDIIHTAYPCPDLLEKPPRKEKGTPR